MPSITDAPPADVKTELLRLQADLDERIPRKRLDDNLIIGTWNLKEFGGLTEAWENNVGSSPKRNLRALRFIAEIVSRFDVVALQEVKGNLKALRHMTKVLGPNYAFLLTDVCRGTAGDDERMAFLFDTRRIKASGLAGELVVPREWMDRTGDQVLREQFARSPYAVSFLSARRTFILVTLHIRYGSGAEDRIPEIKCIAEWMANWAEDEESWRHNLFVLGDFNIDRVGDAAYQAFVSTGLYVPDDLAHLPYTNLAGATKPKHYDQIAWFQGASQGDPQMTLEYREGSSYNFEGVVFDGMPAGDLQWFMSDHFPLWAEFKIGRE